MKHKLFPIVLSCALTLSLIAKADTVTSKVTFGRASSACNGMGVCKTTTTNSVEGISVSFTWNDNTAHLTMHLPASSLAETPENVLAGINAGNFVVEEAFALSRDLIAGLKAPQSIQIAVGTYPARKQSDGSFIVDFGAY